jgi:predicted membrane channel-forming protein YqfA (hemolysin III family)
MLYSFHTTCHQSSYRKELGLRMDYFGIVTLMSTALVPLIHYGFFRTPYLRKVYIKLVRLKLYKNL